MLFITSIEPVLGAHTPDSLVHTLVKNVVPESNVVVVVQLKFTIFVVLQELSVGPFKVVVGGNSTFNVLFGDDFSETIAASSVPVVNALVCVAEHAKTTSFPSVWFSIVKFATISTPTAWAGENVLFISQLPFPLSWSKLTSDIFHPPEGLAVHTTSVDFPSKL